MSTFLSPAGSGSFACNADLGLSNSCSRELRQSRRQEPSAWSASALHAASTRAYAVRAQRQLSARCRVVLAVSCLTWARKCSGQNRAAGHRRQRPVEDMWGHLLAAAQQKHLKIVSGCDCVPCRAGSRLDGIKFIETTEQLNLLSRN